MKQKRGFLLAEETLKIIIAVICIGFLAYLLFSVYQNNSNNKNLDFAKSTLSSISAAINGGQTSVDVYNPSDGWVFDVWPQTTTNGFLLWKTTTPNVEPLFCKNLDWNSCLCICSKNAPDSCDGNSGTCINNTYGFDVVGKSIELKNLPLTLKIDQTNKEISS